MPSWPICITVSEMSLTGHPALIFVRRNDILLQRGMALQAVPLPSLGVSSLDLGRSFTRTAPFSWRAGLFGRGPGHGEARNTGDERGHHGFEVVAQPLETYRLVEARLVHIEGAIDLDLQHVL